MGQALQQVIGSRLRELRKSRGLTLAEVGRATGVTPACVSYWESGTTCPRPKSLEKVATALGTTVPYLLSGGYGHPEGGARPSSNLPAGQVLLRAREEIARAFCVDVSDVRIQIDHPRWMDGAISLSEVRRPDPTH